MDRQTRKGLQLALGLGVGIGLMLGAVGTALTPRPEPTAEQIKEKARALGMVDPTRLPSSPAPAPKEPDKAPQAAQPVRLVTFTVVSGMSSGEIASMLKQTGLIADEKAFQARAAEREVLSRLRTGVYVFTVADPASPPSIDHLLDQLVAGPTS